MHSLFRAFAPRRTHRTSSHHGLLLSHPSSRPHDPFPKGQAGAAAIHEQRNAESYAPAMYIRSLSSSCCNAANTVYSCSLNNGRLLEEVYHRQDLWRQTRQVRGKLYAELRRSIYGREPIDSEETGGYAKGRAMTGTWSWSLLATREAPGQPRQLAECCEDSLHRSSDSTTYSAHGLRQQR